MKVCCSFILFWVFLFSKVCTRDLNGTISTFLSTSTFKDLLAEELTFIEENWNLTSPQPDIGVAKAASTWWLKSSTIMLQNIRIASVRFDGFSLNRTNVIHGAENVRIELEGDNAFYFEFVFDYEYVCYSGGKGTGLVVLLSSITDLTRYTQMVETSSIPKGKTWMEITTNFNKITEARLNDGKYRDDAHVLQLAREAMLFKFENLDTRKAINTELVDTFNRYYASSTNSVMVQMDDVDFISVDVNYKGYPKVTENGYILFYDGAITKGSLGEKGSSLVQHTAPDRSTWDNFDYKLGSYQVFFSSFFFEDILNTYYTGSNLLIDSRKSKKQSMILQLVSPFIKDIEVTYPIDTPFNIATALKNFVLFEGINHFYIRVKGTLDFITSTGNSFLVADVELEFRLTHVLNGDNSINFRIEDNSIQLNDVIIKNAVEVKMNQLKSGVASILNIYNQENPFKLFKYDIATNAFFKKINAIVTIPNQGFLLTGEPRIIQHQSAKASSNEIVEMMMKNLRSN